MIKCSFCDNLMNETDLNCPFCGTPHDPETQGRYGVPHTVFELKKFAHDMGISLERLHFHIGEDYKGAKAFGIYKEERTGNFVVYKNKDNGQRAIRYYGPDEAYAVNELYQKLKERVAKYQNDVRNNPADIYRDPPREHNNSTFNAIFLIILFIFFILLFLFSPPTGSGSSSYGSDSRYESSYGHDSSYSYSDSGSDSGDWSSDW